MDYIYDIRLDAPMGVRSGKMYLHLAEDQVSGELSLLGNKEFFKGTAQKDGVIIITGTITSKVRKLTYKGIGNMYGSRLHMLLCTGNDSYKLTGWLNEMERKCKNEEIL